MWPDYDFKTIEKKWQKKWGETKIHKVDLAKAKNKLYCLVMFLYPSGDKLHIGHWYNYGPTDTWARFKKMQGFDVVEPMGYDAFGLPAENYAIKAGVHPAESTKTNIEFIRGQLKAIGTMYDWDLEINTSSPDYYKWTQWLFLQLYKNKLAYRKKAPVNWCPSCQTVLANEQVINGQCERCDDEVIMKDLEQWFFKITDYAERLLKDHDKIDWPDKTINMQKNWIGKSVGARINFQIEGPEKEIIVFTTRPDTVFGVTYMVLAPEHPLVAKLTLDENREKVKEYIKETRKQKEIERLSTDREKTGVFLGSYCVNPVNGEKIQIWIADYVLVAYGTGAVMAVPAHDQRDFEFAKKYSLPIREVISKSENAASNELTKAYEAPGLMINSNQFNGLKSTNGKKAVIDYLEENNKGGSEINYKLRDWLISRQRYWGAPIPIIFCEDCGEVPVPESDLPVTLPKDVDFSGRGQSPLTTVPDFVNAKCPQCGKMGKREVDTMDTFVCSSWYFLRFLSPNLEGEAFDKETVNKWLPVDQYVGGAEHAVMHLLYARFFTKALYDFGLINFDEPFKKLIHQGIITNRGAKMSKSRGNVVNPDSFVFEYGSDTFRLYMMFMGSYEEGGDWNDEGIVGINRFLKRVWRVVHLINETNPLGDENKAFEKVDRQMHYAIKHSTVDLQRFQFNTSISRIMELVNEIYLYIQNISIEEQNKNLKSDIIPNLVKLLAPFAPHACEEMWEYLGYDYSIFNSNWPTFEESKLISDTVTMGVQVNGKIRGQITVPVETSKDDIINRAKNENKVKQYLAEKQLIKSIVVPKKLVSFVVK
jgi:leucyl-tRNA synthetase